MPLSYWNYVTKNQKSIAKSKECACINCCKRFPPNKVEDFIEDGEKDNGTAECPFCGIDAVVPDSLVAYTEAQLIQWHNEGFN
jgi:hypothetical protein